MTAQSKCLAVALAFVLLACSSSGASQESESDVTGAPDSFDQNPADLVGDSRDPAGSGSFFSTQIDLETLTPEECATAYSDAEDPQGLCESDTAPKLMLFRGKLCALYASDINLGVEDWERVRFDLSCFDLSRSEEGLKVAEVSSSDTDFSFSVDGAAAVASTQTGVWFSDLFLSASTAETSRIASIEPRGLRQLSFADIVDSSGALEPDGVPDALVIYAHWDSEYRCGGNSVPVRRISAGLYPAKANGTFSPLREIYLGWGKLALHPFAIQMLGVDPSGRAVLALPAEERSPSPEFDECFEADMAGIGLIGTLKANSDGSYTLETMVADPEDLRILNITNPMGFARLPDDSGFLGSFSGMGSSSFGSGFSKVAMDGSVSHFSLDYKGNVFPLDYPTMELDFGGVPFDLAVAEKDDGTLLLVHTSRVTDTFLAEVNGLYITSLRPDGSQDTDYVFANGKPLGLLSFEIPGQGLFFASGSSYSRGASDRGLPYNPQVQIWSVSGVANPPPFTSQGYSKIP